MIPAEFLAWRKRLGLTQTEAALALGLSSGRHIRKLETGMTPSGQTIRILELSGLPGAREILINHAKASQNADNS